MRARASGTITHDDEGQSLGQPFRKDVEWLSVYRVEAGRIAEVGLLAVTDRVGQG